MSKNLFSVILFFQSDKNNHNLFHLMISKTFKYLFVSFLGYLIIFYQPKINALSHEWITVPKSEYGYQLWDKQSVKKDQDGFVRVLSKFIPNSTTEITQDILYTMDINCYEKSFRDVAVGSSEFNEFTNEESAWQDPNGDKLIMGVIDQVCNLVN